MLHSKLETIKNTDNNLYEHLAKVLRELLVNNDRNSYQLFEYYSQKIKSK